MSEGKPIIFTADIKSLKVLSGRPVVQIMLETDKAMFEAEGMKEAYSAIGHACLKDDSYKIMFMKSTDAKEVIEHAKAKQEAQYPHKPMVSEGFPWGIAGKEAFARFLDDTTEHTIFNDDGSFTEARNRNVVRIMHGVKSTKQMTNEQNNELIGKYNAWLKEVR